MASFPTWNLRGFPQVVIPAGGSGGWRSSQYYEMRFMKSWAKRDVQIFHLEIIYTLT